VSALIYALRRLALGVLLIAAAAAILLVADRDHRTAAAAAPNTIPRMAILQHANTAVLDEGIRGMLDGLASRGTPARRTAR